MEENKTHFTIKWRKDAPKSAPHGEKNVLVCELHRGGHRSAKPARLSALASISKSRIDFEEERAGFWSHVLGQLGTLDIEDSEAVRLCRKIAVEVPPPFTIPPELPTYQTEAGLDDDYRRRLARRAAMVEALRHVPLVTRPRGGRK